MSFTAGLWAYLQTSLLLLAAACLLPARLRLWRGFRVVAPSLLIPAAFLPLGGSDLTGHVYAYTGALSLPSLTLIAGFLANRIGWTGPVPDRERRMILTGAAIAAMILYPMALGLSLFDPYSMGYSGLVLPLMVASGATLAWWGGRRSTAMILAAVLWSWLLELGESQNLWDYLLDAWLGLYAVVWLLAAPLRAKSPPRSCDTSN